MQLVGLHIFQVSVLLVVPTIPTSTPETVAAVTVPMLDQCSHPGVELAS